jgi:hypothetical protein
MKENQEQLIKCVVLIGLLIQEIDTVTEKPTSMALKLRERLGLSQETLIELFDDVYAKSNISRTTFFQTVQKKLNYNLDRQEQKLFKA